MPIRKRKLLLRAQQIEVGARTSSHWQRTRRPVHLGEGSRNGTGLVQNALGPSEGDIVAVASNGYARWLRSRGCVMRMDAACREHASIDGHFIHATGKGRTVASVANVEGCRRILRQT